jgi:hypothetical protein
MTEEMWEFKRKLTAGFHHLRFDHGYFAAQCFQCCQTCGCAAVPDKYAERYVFYHEQDAERLDAATTDEELGVYLAWAGDAQKIRKVLEQAGCAVVHDGNPKRRIWVCAGPIDRTHYLVPADSFYTKSSKT